MQPIVNGLEELYGQSASFLYLNAHEEGEAAFIEAALPGHPSLLILLPDGRELYRAFGVQTEEALRQALENALAAQRDP